MVVVFLLLMSCLDHYPVVLDHKSFSIRLIYPLFIPECSFMYLFSTNDIFYTNAYDFIALVYLFYSTEYHFYIMLSECDLGRAASTFMIVSNE